LNHPGGEPRDTFAVGHGPPQPTRPAVAVDEHSMNKEESKQSIEFLLAEVGTIGKAEAEWVSALQKFFPEDSVLREEVALATKAGFEAHATQAHADRYNAAGWVKRLLRRLTGKPVRMEDPAPPTTFQSECVTAMSVTQTDWIGVGLHYLEEKPSRAA